MIEAFITRLFAPYARNKKLSKPNGDKSTQEIYKATTLVDMVVRAELSSAPSNLDADLKVLTRAAI